jgi:uncharacterized membrane protein YheB (UPF0754 family)
MDVSLGTAITVPLLGGVIGWVTNRIAVRMIFRPLQPRRVLGLTVQGLIGRRQRELAESIGRVVGDHLLSHEDVVRAVETLELEQILGTLLDRGLADKLAELRGLPLIGGFLTDERIAQIRAMLVRGVLAEREAIFAAFEQALEQGLDVRRIVTDKVAAFPVLRLEQLVLEVARRELRAIEILGGVLGLLIGIGQLAVIAASRG